jgi:hypothetical protein
LTRLRRSGTTDFTHAEGEEKGRARSGTYVLEADTLKIHDNADDLGKGRPAAFATEPGSRRVPVKVKREGR